MLTSKEKSDTKRLPMMPIREVVIFPYMMTPFVVGRESSVRALEEAMAGDKKIFLAAQTSGGGQDQAPPAAAAPKFEDTDAMVQLDAECQGVLESPHRAPTVLKEVELF